MTPTLAGRLQTRLLLYIFIGLPMTALFTWVVFPFIWGGELVPEIPFYFLTAILVLGLILDFVYIQIQRFRWDNDWPFAFQFFFSILEFAAVWGLVQAGLLDPLILPEDIPNVWIAATHFALVFIPSFIALLGLVQIFCVRWRFKGGELGRHGT
ncbi:MAG: hypothetical protein Kow0032_11670 [Methyloligellaceae bacterium]